MSDVQEPFEQSTDAARYQTIDHEQSDEDLRRAARNARTEDEYLEILREAGSLGAGMAVVTYDQAKPSAIIGSAGARRRAEDSLRDARLYGTPEDFSAAYARLEAARTAERAQLSTDFMENA